MEDYKMSDNYINGCDYIGLKKCGFDTRIHKWSEITRPELISIGNHVSIDMNVYISTKAIIGNWIHIAPGVSIIGGADSQLVMEDFTSLASVCRVICASDDFREGFLCPFIPIKYRHVINEPIVFKKYSGVGCNSVLMPGVTLAEGAVIGANSVVTKKSIIEPWGIYVGSPVKLIGYRDKELILKGAKELGY
jgi:acetyltransferase-like isoleucine patch superfamily enzyme